MSTRKSRIAAKHVNVMDRVEAAPHAPVPAYTMVRRVDTDETLDFVREKTRTTGAFWSEFNDLTLADLVGSL